MKSDWVSFRRDSVFFVLAEKVRSTLNGSTVVLFDLCPHIAVVWQKKRLFGGSFNIFAHTLRCLAENCTSLKYFLNVKRIVNFVLEQA